ncbi:MAG: DUF4389 domain-containing protein [Syntrophobacteraceae bacterium]
MNEIETGKLPRGKIGIRLIFTLICMIICYVVNAVIQALALVQYLILLITRNYSEPLRRFSNQAATYNYKLVRYITLNDNARPFPFNDFPPVMEAPEEIAKFD